MEGGEFKASQEQERGLERGFPDPKSKNQILLLTIAPWHVWNIVTKKKDSVC